MKHLAVIAIVPIAVVCVLVVAAVIATAGAIADEF